MNPALDLTRLAADYCESVRESLTVAELAAVNLHNTAESNAAVDHVHDFIDANDCMFEALQRQSLSFNDVLNEVNNVMRRARDNTFQLRRVLVACEYSGRVRDAIAQYGHDVMSCDILPTDSPGKHYQGDVRDILGDDFTDMISHPPCTYIANSQMWRCNRDPARMAKSDQALDFVRDLMAAPMDRQALENPVSRISSAIRKPEQYIQPFQFGHDHSKKTGLWLDNLTPLTIDPAMYIEPRQIVYKGRTVNRWGNQSPCGADSTPPSPQRWKIRSTTFQNIADAIALQWFNPQTISS